MKKIVWLLAVVGIFSYSSPVIGQKRRIQWGNEPNGLVVKSSNERAFRFEFSVNGFEAEDVLTPVGSFTRIHLGGFVHSLEEGIPEFPVLTEMIEVPWGTTPRIYIQSIETRNISLRKKGFQNQVYPVQPSVPKTNQQNSQKFIFNKVLYNKDTLIQSQLVYIQPIGIMRGRNLSILSISPFRYRPLTNELVVVTKLDVSVEFVPKAGGSGEVSKKYDTKSFKPVYEKVLNFQPDQLASGSYQAIKYVILSDSSFRDALQPFIRWKTRKGFKVIEVYKGAPGVGTSADEMKAYLSNLYHSATPEDPAFSYLLIVGDDEQIPAFRDGHITDLYYAEYDGNGDFIPDVFYGRFSAKDTAELNPQIEKTLEYEQYLFPDPAFLNEVVMIAGVDGSYASKWGNGQINYGTQYYFNAAHGLNSHTYLYPESGSSDMQIIQDISAGAGFVNYTGHGEWNRWIDPTFSITDIDSLKNKHKYPLMIGNGCVTTVFNIDNCLGEALLRARDKGALGYIGCSNDSYWDEDYWWAVGTGLITENPTYEETGSGMYDLSFHEHGEPENEWATTQDQIIFAGNMAVMESNTSRSKYYWEIYHLLGDPSLSIYFSVPDSIPCSTLPSLPSGSTRLQFLTLPNIYAGLSRNDTLIAGVFSDESGLIDLTFAPLYDTGKVDLILTGQNRKPLVTSVRVVQQIEPFVMLENLTVRDSAGNGNQVPDYGEILWMDATLKNYGNEPATHVSVNISSQSPYLTLIDTTLTFDTLSEHAEKIIPHAFLIRVKDSIHDQSDAILRILTTDQMGRVTTSFYKLKLYAPGLSIKRMEINDNLYGNGNKRLDPGESVEVKVTFENVGHSMIKDLIATLHSRDSMLSINPDSIEISELDSMGLTTGTFALIADSAIEKGKQDYLTFTLGNTFYHVVDSFPVALGRVYEDFETGDFNLFRWIEDDLHPWSISTDRMFEGDFSAQSAAILNDQTSQLGISLYIPQRDTISFFYKVSSEADYDFLRFYVDDTLKQQWSGEINWSYFETIVQPGDHSFKWIYAKDQSVNSGLDRAWIDYIIFPDNSFLKYNTGVTKVVSPQSGINLTNHEVATIELFNYGNDTIFVLPVGYFLDGGSLETDTIRTAIFPGQAYLHTFSTPLDLSEPGVYNLTFFTAFPFDKITGNDTLNITISHYIPDAGISRIILPVSDSVFSDTATIQVVIKNYGTQPLPNIPVGYYVSDTFKVFEVSNLPVKPGDSLIYTFENTVDLSSFDSCRITVFTDLLNDYFNENDTSWSMIKLLGINSVEPTNAMRELTIYPNPSNGQVYLLFKKIPNEIRYTIQSLSGKTLKQNTIPKNILKKQISLNLTTLPDGMYMLIIESENKRSVFKILKQS